MFYPIENGTFEIVGEHYKCWIPPQPPDNQIAGWNLKKEDQYWRRTMLPEWWEERSALEAEKRAKEEELLEAGKIDKVTYVDPMCEKFRRQEWDRRLNGFWFFNNGKATYITGKHYIYLNWSRFGHSHNDGYPKYYDSSRKRFYFRAYCEQDPHCIGYVIGGPRGFGKSVEESSCIVEESTRPPHRSKSAVQSKSEEDAIKIFGEIIVPCFNSYPPFFKPVFNHGSKAESKLSFFRDSKRGKAAKQVKYSDDFELQNQVYPVSSKEKALDGRDMRNILVDEDSKLLDYDAYERHSVNRFCVWRNDRKVGMIRAVSTVEDIEYTHSGLKGLRGGDAFKKIWDDSNPIVRTANGMTLSGLYRYFQPKSEVSTKFEDKYGFIDLKKAIEYEGAERKAREHDFMALATYIRKNPETQSEMFIKDAKNSTFNTHLLTQWKEWARMNSKIWVRGNLEWKDKIDGDVYFERNDHSGRWWFSLLPDDKGGPFMAYGETKIANNVGVEIDYDGKAQYSPKNARRFRIGCDPIKNIKTTDPRASHLSMHGMFLYDDQLDKGTDKKDWKSHKIFFRYNDRPEDPVDAYEDVIKTLRYLGAPINAEKNISDLHSHLEARGYGKFLMRKKDFDASILQKGRNPEESLQSDPAVISTYINRIKTFLRENKERFAAIPFEETLQQLHDYDILNPTRFDDVVSLGYTLLAIEAQWEEDLDHVNEVAEWFDMFDNSGDISKTVEEDEFYELL